MYNVLGASDSSTPGTKGSSTTAVYQPPHFDVDAYGSPAAPRFTQGLSQNRENAPAVEEAEEEENTPEPDIGRHPYKPADTMTLFNAWIGVSCDPSVGNQQTRKCFWEKVTTTYNQNKPASSRPRTLKMLRNHFDRVDRDVKKFCGIYRAEAASYQSGADILRAALRVFLEDTGKEFKHVDVWESVKDVERWAGGVQSSTGSSSKRTKHTAGGQYSSSEGAEASQDFASQEVEGSATEAGGSSRGRRRPQGTKAAKAARGRRGRGESSQADAPSHTAMSVYFTATMANTSHMTPQQYQAHLAGIHHMARQLGIPPPSSFGPPPPPSGDDSPAE